jgi:hypothetical protein
VIVVFISPMIALSFFRISMLLAPLQESQPESGSISRVDIGDRAREADLDAESKVAEFNCDVYERGCKVFVNLKLQGISSESDTPARC